MERWSFIAAFVCVALELTCAANGTSFPNENCELEPDPGICRGMFMKWFYNSTSFRCETFYYGGCLGNDNKFDTVTECNMKCREFSHDPCFLPKHPGRNCTGEALMQNYWFNGKTKSCEVFDYGGCGGNGNNFLEESECWRTCGNYVESRCVYPMKSGYSCPNGSKEVVFGYNSQTRRCERFVYAGCGGYPNKFQNASECWKTCGLNSASKCMEPGPKNSLGLVKKYYYDIETDTCKTSRYSPFSSKKNRFDTLAECEMECKGNFTYESQAA